MKFETLQIRSFRGIEKLDLNNIKRINLFIGKNNCGKTSVLEALFLITAPANPALPLNINHFRGCYEVNEYFWRLNFNNLNGLKPIEISSTMIKPSQKRELVIKPQYENISFPLEEKKTISFVESSSISSPTINGLNLTLKYCSGEGEEPNVVHSTVRISGMNINFSSPEDYHEEMLGVFLSPSTINADIGKRFHEMNLKKQTQKVIEILKLIEPKLVSLSLGEKGDIYCDIGLENLIPLNILGDGLIRILAIVLAIIATPGGVVYIDEIENGFYFSSLKILWQTVIRLARDYDVQLFITTHSRECLTSLVEVCSEEIIEDPEDIVVYRIEKRENFHEAIKYDYDLLSTSLETGWEVR